MSPETNVRVWFTGTLRSTTALHIGTGSALSPATDAPVVRGADGAPFIPGSSMKGALRSASERLLRALGRRACMVFGDETAVKAPEGAPSVTHSTACLSTDKWSQTVFLKLRRGDKLDPDEERYAETHWGLNRKERMSFGTREDLQQKVLEDRGALCDACLTWGSQFMAGRVRVPDLAIDPDTWFGATEIRDGVGLDRDTGTAAPNIKFDLEVVPARAGFPFELVAEPGADLGVVSLAIGELLQGAIPIGGRTTRGLGAVTLENLTIHEVDLTDPEQLFAFLTGGRSRATVHGGDDAKTYLETCLRGLMEGKDHAA